MRQNRFPSMLHVGLFCAILSIVAVDALPAPELLPAFPGAQGFGAATPGGRHGKVIAVTNLNDSGPGSLRAALESPDPRIVVFRVAGTIALQSPIAVRHPYLTVAGQTAPGGGIAIRNHTLLLDNGLHDAVIRHLRIRPGLGGRAEPDGIGVYAGDKGPIHDVIIDHCSVSWAVDENIGMGGGSENVTIQWCLIAEGSMTGHHKGPHSMGILCGGEHECQRVSIHHNLFANNNQRNPRIQGGRVDFINNVVHNWGQIAGQLTWAPHANFIGNHYSPGPSSRRDRHVIETDGAFPLYVRDNISLRRPKGTEYEWACVGAWTKPADASQRREKPWPGAPIEVTIESAAEARERVLDNAGATLPERDGVDRRIVHEARTGGGELGIRGEYPNLDGVAPADTDGDGMPDDWERDFELDPFDKWDGPGDTDGDGYTNVEEYLNATDPLIRGK